jgi:hypothetical protein
MQPYTANSDLRVHACSALWHAIAVAIESVNHISI